jgi:hypothetical protein
MERTAREAMRNFLAPEAVPFYPQGSPAHSRFPGASLRTSLCQSHAL